jgi:hypothetical protein
VKRAEKLTLSPPKSIPDKPTRARRPWFREAVPRERPRKLDIQEGEDGEGVRDVRAKVTPNPRPSSVVMW